MKKTLALIATSAIAVAAFAGCGNEGTSKSTSVSSISSASTSSSAGTSDVAGKKVAYSLGNTFEERWQTEIKMFQEYFDNIGVEFEYQLAENDNNKQVAQIETFLSQGVDAIIITPADADAAATIAKACDDDDVPLIVYDQPLNSPLVDYLCTFDAVETGELEAQAVYDAAPEGNYVVLYGDAANINAQNIAKGFDNVIGDAVDSGKINIVLEQWVDSWDPTLALQYVENALTANNNDIQGILSPNDGIAGGAIEALTAQGLAGEVPTAGQDADIAACQRIVAGTQSGTVYKNLINLNKATCQLVEAILSGAEDPTAAVDSSIAEITTFVLDDGSEIPLIAPEQVFVTAENMKEVIIDGGFHTMEEVYANIPKDEWPE